MRTKTVTAALSRYLRPFIILIAAGAISLSGCFESSTEKAPPSINPPPTAAPVPPSAVDDTLSVPPDTSGVVAVLDNDSAADSGTLVIDTFTEVSEQGGSVVNNGDGTFTYTPPQGYQGPDRFSYTIVDNNGEHATAAVAVTISDQVIPDGRAYYASNCGICHAAGSDDTSTAFHASDLAQRANPLLRDLSVYGGEYQLMGTFYGVGQQQIDELKAYLANLGS